MAKKPVQAVVATKSVTKVVNRKSRNALERKCLPKTYKIMFAGSDRATFRSLLKAWQEGRKKVAAVK